MPNEIHADYDSGNTLYAVIRNTTGQAWDVAGQAFEDWGTNGHTIDDYNIPLTDKSGSRYVGNFDSHIPAGRYCIQVFVQAGASPADTDAIVTARDVVWTGSGMLTAAKVLANKAVFNKTTGAIEYYDDDAQTVLLTHASDDGASTTTRTPA